MSRESPAPGKASALKAFEDLGYHAVDNLPLELLPDFATLVEKSADSATARRSWWMSARARPWTACRRFSKG